MDKTLYAFFALGLLIGALTFKFLIPGAFSDSIPTPVATSLLTGDPNFTPNTFFNKGDRSAKVISNDSREDALKEILQLISEKNPLKREALEYAALAKLSSDDLEKCMKLMAVLPQGRNQIELEMLLLHKIAKNDPAKALEIAFQIPNTAASHKLAGSLFSDWLNSDSDAAWKWAEQLPAGSDRNLFLKAGLTALASKDPSTTAAFILQIAGQPGSEALYKDAATQVALQLLKKNTDALNDFIAKLPEGPAKTFVVCNVAQALSATDPKMAATFLLSGEQSLETIHNLSTILTNWGQQDLPSALAFAQTLTGDQQTWSMSRLLPLLAKTDLNSAITLMSKLNNYQVTYSLMASLARNLDTNNPQQSLLLASQIPDGNAKNFFLAQYGEKLTEVNPRTAAGWLNQLPESPAKNAAMTAIVDPWIEKDPNGLSSFVQTLPSGPVRDIGIKRLLESGTSTHQNPENLIQLAAALNNENDRTTLVSEQYAVWLKQSPAAAQTWLANTTSLDPSLKQKLGTTP